MNFMSKSSKCRNQDLSDMIGNWYRKESLDPYWYQISFYDPATSETQV